MLEMSAILQRAAATRKDIWLHYFTAEASTVVKGAEFWISSITVHKHSISSEDSQKDY